MLFLSFLIPPGVKPVRGVHGVRGVEGDRAVWPREVANMDPIAPLGERGWAMADLEGVVDDVGELA